MGITLFGTANKTTADSPHDHVCDLVPIDVPNALGIRTVDRLEKTLSGAPASNNTNGNGKSRERERGGRREGGRGKESGCCSGSTSSWSTHRLVFVF